MTNNDPFGSDARVQALIQELEARAVCDSDLKMCRENWPDDPGSWCEGCLHHAAIAALRSVGAASPGEREKDIRCPVLWANHNRCERPVGHLGHHLVATGFTWAAAHDGKPIAAPAVEPRP